MERCAKCLFSFTELEKHWEQWISVPRSGEIWRRGNCILVRKFRKLEKQINLCPSRSLSFWKLYLAEGGGC